VPDLRREGVDLMTKEIPLTQGFFALVDDEDYEALNKFKWHVDERKDGKDWRAVRSLPRTKTGPRKTIFMHRFILNANDGQIVDHKNGNGLDNRRANIRLCSQGQNLANMRNTQHHSSRFKGVYWYERVKKWQVNIRKDGRTQYLGRFYSEEVAARVYDAKAKELFGDFAKLNFEEVR
jgi:hypothetical protein